ncbi:Alpha-1,2-mannosyltransferase [Schizosaccharomyces pombe]
MNATLFMLCRNRDIKDALVSIQSVEDRFNHRYHYPWTFMNDAPFTKEFITATSKMVSGDATYVQLNNEEWGIPINIDLNRMLKSIRDMTDDKVIYGFSLSYRIMCRFNSGFFYRNKALSHYDYYWRVEPGVEYSCDIPYDPFRKLSDENKAYGFVISMTDYYETLPSLWNVTRDFIHQNPQYLAQNNSLDFIVNDHQGLSGDYNLCHFWSNFEIANLNFFRSPAYTDYFAHLDKNYGFFYERWGDAPVHSLAASLFLNKSQIHYFEDFGYYHLPWYHCPTDVQSHATARCLCDPTGTIDYLPFSCAIKWLENINS